MYIDTPTANISGELRALREEETSRNRRNLETAGGLLRDAATGAIRSRYEQGLKAVESVAGADEAFQRQYAAMLATNPEQAQQLRKDYEAERVRRIGLEVAGAYQGAIEDAKDQEAAGTQASRAASAAMMPYDPGQAMQWQSQAEGMDIRRANIKEEASPVYTPEQKQLVDAKQQNRISLDKAISSLNAATQRGDEEQIAYWDVQVKALKANDQRINDQLAGMGVGGYAKSEAQAAQADVAGPVDLDKDLIQRREFMRRYSPKTLAEVPTESDIMADAQDSGYNVSRSGASQIRAEIKSRVEAAYSDVQTKQSLEGQKQSQAQQRIEDAYKRVDLKYPGLREKGIDLVNSAISFVQAGDAGDQSARNNLVKKIARMGSDEALSDTDFGRALGRDMGMNFVSRIATAITGAGAPISDAEWAKLREFARRHADEIRSTVKAADPSGKLLRQVKPWPLLRGGAAQGGKNGTANKSKLDRIRALRGKK